VDPNVLPLVYKTTTKTPETMKARTFESGNGTKKTTSDKAEIKMMKACGWKEIKTAKVTYAKGLENGSAFLN
jgi:hypothetical protein